MQSFRGRGGPRQSTPANVQCQKCLKRGHYSYECKEPAQTRPYVSRPSRTQQLRNPKLMPKLTNETPDDADRKKGIADAELAKKEAERARKRELDERDDELIRKTESKRQRSESVDSVSTISTSRSASPPPPPPRRRSPSPVPSRRRQRAVDERKPSRARSFSPESEDDRPVSRRSARSRRTPSPPRRRQRSLSRDSRSRSPPETHERKYRERDQDRARPAGQGFARDTPGSRESSISRGGRASSIRRSLSRSPGRRDTRGGGRFGRGGRRNSIYRDGSEPRTDRVARNERQEGRPEQKQPERERSLSPFSKRLALTQSLNMGR